MLIRISSNKMKRAEGGYTQYNDAPQWPDSALEMVSLRNTFLEASSIVTYLRLIWYNSRIVH
ncbi:hypothetical protein MNBD_BACTEROID03-807 [hydrothermal vent metagenome]|uniref:Uncharacterized protein n=1 Tax=hydrothermal vent metagenome TaxID=652676 RepID=A0A3B0TB48_9ZZZZ